MLLPPSLPFPQLEGSMNTPTINMSSAKGRGTLGFLSTAIHSLVNPLQSLSIQVQGQYSLHSVVETGPERWSDLLEVKRFLSGGDGTRLSITCTAERALQGEVTGCGTWTMRSKLAERMNQ